MQQVAQLDQQTKQLAASSKHLQEDNNGLRVKIQQIEQLQTSYRTAQLDEQIQDLTASSRDLKEQNNCLNDRILQLEQEGTHRDQDNQLLQKQLKEKISVLDDELKSVVSAMSKMHETARAEPGKRRGAIQQSRSQVEAVVATKYTRGGHVRGGKSGERAIRRVVSNIRHSIKTYTHGHYRGRKHANQRACRAAATAQGRSPS